ncbi:haloacid dehalogenase-like hydrolase [Odoribacter sp. OttesenSCG-928-L07]|nr:haloacid dehalogenase-like hydrolase [Odoribacter sp. OttesenSCG-928-L07]MDL2239185.1 haloacid dehalogenase-like hydrolase [Bacteroidales bacterium OttesenSCG-928-L14]MDL2240529.1 haloacid dehalogenase-like hydrolase [Bacteroidales bacterium OttesenSCG-928-K22]
MDKIESKFKIAFAYDFDGTLAPGNMQEHKFIPELGIGNNEFWQEANIKAEENDMDEILAYMQLMLEKAEEKNISIKKDSFTNYGKSIKLFNGVETYFDRINEYASERNIEIEHHIISSGLREFVSGTVIAKHFKNIFASGFKYNKKNIAEWPAVAINYTNKTQYLYRINKGVNNSYDNTIINKYIPYEDRTIPFTNMVYIGDGETDVPAMKMIKYQRGTAIAVYNPSNKISPISGKTLKEQCMDLIRQNRVHYIAPADYTEGSELDKIIKLVIDKLSAENFLKAQMRHIKP